MKIGLLVVGSCNPAMAPKWGLYPPLFETLLARADPTLETRSVKVLDGEFPDSVFDADGWLITGSKYGVYDDLPWMRRLSGFLRDAYAADAPVVGVCFGHQILAHAFGAVVEKSNFGWGVGVQRYQTFEDPAWFGDAPPELALHGMHQDQVSNLPSTEHGHARILATSPFCPFAALAYGPATAPRAISIQPHPEFEEAFERDIVVSRRGQGIPEGLADDALASLGAYVHNAEVAAWFVRFFRAAAARRRAAD